MQNGACFARKQIFVGRSGSEKWRCSVSPALRLGDLFSKLKHHFKALAGDLVLLVIKKKRDLSGERVFPRSIASRGVGGLNL